MASYHCFIDMASDLPHEQGNSHQSICGTCTSATVQRQISKKTTPAHALLYTDWLVWSITWLWLTSCKASCQSEGL